MKKKLNLTIDEDVYYSLDDFPRRVSISEIVTWVLRGMAVQGFEPVFL